MHWKTYERQDMKDGGNNRIPIDDETDKESYHLLCTQLRSAVEKRAAQISKSVINELERRLLQRTQSGWFETFLAAILLLNCVERGSWLFHTWNSNEYESKVNFPLPHPTHIPLLLLLLKNANNTLTTHHQWPLDCAASSLVSCILSINFNCKIKLEKLTYKENIY